MASKFFSLNEIQNKSFPSEFILGGVGLHLGKGQPILRLANRAVGTQWEIYQNNNRMSSNIDSEIIFNLFIYLFLCFLENVRFFFFTVFSHQFLKIKLHRR